mmetsp:Transcript_9702/g.36038  ORF Transcript_9702/g.36038 Transcript_9702/m.36038 type:complete len:208 (-) Transcript_9702:1870-2493(-)
MQMGVGECKHGLSWHIRIAIVISIRASCLTSLTINELNFKRHGIWCIPHIQCFHVIILFDLERVATSSRLVEVVCCDSNEPFATVIYRNSIELSSEVLVALNFFIFNQGEELLGIIGDGGMPFFQFLLALLKGECSCGVNNVENLQFHLGPLAVLKRKISGQSHQCGHQLVTLRARELRVDRIPHVLNMRQNSVCQPVGKDNFVALF